MSIENVKLFFEKVSTDDKLQNDIEQLSDATNEQFIHEMISLGRENGYVFNREDIERLILEIVVTLLNDDILLEDGALTQLKNALHYHHFFHGIINYEGKWRNVH